LEEEESNTDNLDSKNNRRLSFETPFAKANNTTTLEPELSDSDDSTEAEDDDDASDLTPTTQGTKAYSQYKLPTLADTIPDSLGRNIVAHLQNQDPLTPEETCAIVKRWNNIAQDPKTFKAASPSIQGTNNMPPTMFLALDTESSCMTILHHFGFVPLANKEEPGVATFYTTTGSTKPCLPNLPS
jgi:hypothetical protein